jgi:hypothetical protein
VHRPEGIRFRPTQIQFFPYSQLLYAPDGLGRFLRFP